MTVEHISSLADLRPGDIMFGPIGGLVPGVFPVGAGQLILGEAFRVGRLSIRHAGIVVAGYRGSAPATYVVEAMPRGARLRRLTEADWTARHAYVRLPEDYPGQAAHAAGIARLFVDEKVPYSFASYLALAAWRFGVKTPRLERWINRRRAGGIGLPAEAICSVLVDQAWSLAGKRVMSGVAPQCVTPGALAGSLFHRPGVIWSDRP